jgi:hypothetical protein
MKSRLSLLSVLACIGALALGPVQGALAGDMDLPVAPAPAPVAEAELPQPESRPPDPEAETPVFEETEPPPRIYDEDVPAEGESIIYVIDTSGSMTERVAAFTDLEGRPTNGTRMDRAKIELIRSILALPDTYEFNIVAYSCTLLRWSYNRRRATPANKTDAAQWVMTLQPFGGTGTGPAVAVALGERDNKTIALLTDGAPGCGQGDTIDSHFRMIVSNNVQAARVHCFGIGAYGVFEQFLRDVSQATAGRYVRVD